MLNRCDTKCGQSMISFHAIWGLCWYRIFVKPATCCQVVFPEGAQTLGDPTAQKIIEKNVAKKIKKLHWDTRYLLFPHRWYLIGTKIEHVCAVAGPKFMFWRVYARATRQLTKNPAYEKQYPFDLWCQAVNPTQKKSSTSFWMNWTLEILAFCMEAIGLWHRNSGTETATRSNGTLRTLDLHPKPQIEISWYWSILKAVWTCHSFGRKFSWGKQ